MGHLAPEREPEPEQTTVIPTAEEAARAAGSLRSQRALLSLAPSANWRSCTDALLPATIDTVLPLLDAIAAGRVFEVRPERCADCGGEGGGYIDTMFAGEHAEEWTDCARCDGSGYEPAPPGRKQRTAYDAMIDGATGDGTLSGSTQPSGEASATLLAPAPPSRQ